MTWYEVTIETDNKSENLLTEILWGLDSAGVHQRRARLHRLVR